MYDEIKVLSLSPTSVTVPANGTAEATLLVGCNGGTVNTIKLIAMTPLSIKDMTPSGGTTIVPEVSMSGNTVNYRPGHSLISSFQVVPSNKSKQWRVVVGTGISASAAGTGIKTFSVETQGGQSSSSAPVGGIVADNCMIAQYTDNSAKSETICFNFYGYDDASCSITVDGSATGKDSDTARLMMTAAQNVGPGMAQSIDITIDKLNNFKYTRVNVPCHSRVTVNKLTGTAKSATPMLIEDLKGNQTIIVDFGQKNTCSLTVQGTGDTANDAEAGFTVSGGSNNIGTLRKENNYKMTISGVKCGQTYYVRPSTCHTSKGPNTCTADITEQEIKNLQGDKVVMLNILQGSAKNITVDCEGNGSTGVTCWLSDTASADVKITADLTMGRTTNYNGNCSYIDYVDAPSVTVTIPKGSKSGSNSVTFHPGPANVNDIRHVDGKASGTGSYALDLSFVSAGLSISSTGGDKFTVNSAWAQKMSDIENNSYYYSSASSCAGTGAEYKNHVDFWHSVRQYQSSHLNSKP